MKAGRIRRALCKQLRHTDVYEINEYEMGNKVYYQRVDCLEWKAPGVIIGQDGAVVFVRHGRTCIRVHYLRLRKVNTENEDRGFTKDDTDIERDIFVEILFTS